MQPSRMGPDRAFEIRTIRMGPDRAFKVQTMSLNIVYSGRTYTEKEGMRLKVLHYPLQYPLQTIRIGLDKAFELQTIRIG